MLKLPFKGYFTKTQEFNDPCCRKSYAQFGLCGHNGWDFGTPLGTELYPPHDGKITESQYDSSYGNYVKIENDVEASVIAHMKGKPVVNVGDKVVMGETLLGYSGNTGNSTGPHVHWGYIRNPRNRNNGFNGYVDQTYFMDLIDCGEELEDMRTSRNAWKAKCNEYAKLQKKSEIKLLEQEKIIEDLRAVILTQKPSLSVYSSTELCLEILSRLGIRVPNKSNKLNI